MPIHKLTTDVDGERRYVTVTGIKVWAHEYVRSTRTTTWALTEDWKKDADFVIWLEQGMVDESIGRSALAHDYILFKQFMNETDTSWSEFVDQYGTETDVDDSDADGDGFEDWDCESYARRKLVTSVPLHIEPCEDDEEPIVPAMSEVVAVPETVEPVPVYEELSPPVQGLQIDYQTLNLNQININNHARNLALALHQMVDTLLNIPDGTVTWTPCYMTYFRSEFTRVMDEHTDSRAGTLAQTVVVVNHALEIAMRVADQFQSQRNQ